MAGFGQQRIERERGLCLYELNSSENVPGAFHGPEAMRGMWAVCGGCDGAMVGRRCSSEVDKVRLKVMSAKCHLS